VFDAVRSFAVLALLGAVLVPTAAEAAPTPAAVRPAAAPFATGVCALYCDTRDPSLARQETFPVAEKQQNGRRVVLHVSDADGMAWGSIDNGTTGNAVWLDRTWTDGSNWDGLLGRASIPSSWTGTRTLMYNLSDPVIHRRGMIRACGDASGIVCTDWVYRAACGAGCDGADAASAQGDAQPVGATSISGRRIELHLDNRGLAWGVLAGGAAGDEVWLDRSWDGGSSWPDGSSLGRVSVPGGASGVRTTMFTTRDTRALLYGGAVRACGRAVTGANGSCTAWARSSSNRADAAADALMWSYDPSSAWWPSSWWNSAVALTTLIDYARRTGRTDYRWIIDRTFTVNKGPFGAGARSGDAVEGSFISRSTDDSEWWAVAWIAAYDLTRDSKYLDMAVTIANYINTLWDSSCGGGVWWDRERTYKNAITNGLWVRITASLHNRISGDSLWLSRATSAWNWFAASGMINGSRLVNDGIDRSCRNNNGTVWTYNQGLAIGGAVEVWRATGDSRVLTSARQLADAALSSGLVGSGVLTESCDNAGTCDDNQKQFKGVFMRYMLDLADATGSYRPFIQTQADAIWNRDRDSLNRLGERWSGAEPNARDWRTQASALNSLF
jgi:predicted alpha-1,6-mannanase (GH76 family)